MRKFRVHKDGRTTEEYFIENPMDYVGQVFDRFDDWCEQKGYTLALPYHEFAGGMGWQNEENSTMYLVEVK